MPSCMCLSYCHELVVSSVDGAFVAAVKYLYKCTRYIYTYNTLCHMNAMQNMNWLYSTCGTDLTQQISVLYSVWPKNIIVHVSVSYA